MKKVVKIGLIIIVILLVFLRFYRLDLDAAANNISGITTWDEPYYTYSAMYDLISSKPTFPPALKSNALMEIISLQSSIITKIGFFLAGNTLEGLRLGVVLLSLLTIFLLYKIAVKTFDFVDTQKMYVKAMLFCLLLTEPTFLCSAELRHPRFTLFFGLFTKRVRDEIIQAKEHSLFIRGIRSWVGFKQTGIEYERDKRYAGEPKFTFKNLFSLAYNGIFSFSDFPIRILTKLGFYLILISVGYTIFSLIRFFQGNTPTGFTTLAIAIFFFGSVQIFTVGIVGEYVLRTYNESRNRPIYIINKKYK